MPGPPSAFGFDPVGLAAILDSALDAIVTMDSTGAITGWNAEAAVMFGRPAAEVIGRRLADVLIPARYREAHQQGLDRFLSTGEGPILRRRLEIEALRQDGREFPVELTVTPVEVAGGWQFSAFLRDITTGREAAEALRSATERFELVSRATNDAVWDWDFRTGLASRNEAYQALFGYPPQSAPRIAAWKDRIHPEDRDRVVGGLRRAVESGGSSWTDEYRFICADGSVRVVLDRGYVSRNAEGAPLRMVGAMMDVTARRRAEQLERAIYRIAEAANTDVGLRELLHDIHAIVGELLPAENFYIALYDEATELLTFPYYVDQRDPPPPPRRLGLGLTEYVLRTGAALSASPKVHRVLEQRGEVILIGAPSEDWLGVPLKTLERTIGVLVVQTYTAGVQYGEREREILQFVSSQVAAAIERKRTEEQLREGESKYRLIFESNPEAMWVYHRESLRFLAINDAAMRRYGYSRAEFQAMSVTDIRLAEDRPRTEAAPAPSDHEDAFLSGLRHRRKDGTLLDVEIRSDPIDFAGQPARLVLVRDVTEQKQLEDRLRQAQKMEAVGQLAGGIAHDFNNLLTAITGYTDLLLEDAAAEGPMRQDLEEIRKAAWRAAALTQQLLAFSRKQVLESRVIDLNTVVSGAERLLGRLLEEHIALRTELAADLGLVKADPAQFEQVIVNLAVNARDAMPRGGELRIETRNIELDSRLTAEHSVVPAGSYVELSVADTGTGMDERIKARLFEPFFTTKGLGKGTGLGLSTVYGIVKQSGGSIAVASTPGKGTVFTITLPRVDGEAEGLAAPSAPHGVLGGTEAILLVEDESALRAVARRVLVRYGYQVIEAPDAESALGLAAAHSETLDLLLTDVIMPGLSGAELANRLTALRPRIRVLFMSGYSDEAIAQQGVLAPRSAYLQKPFEPEALARKVREVLDGATR